ncbi:MAG: class I SAM-dependent methyltransferase [Planctomycetota bacterium]|jgi:23S rRNA (cytosine1962-C5)-methyltransferase
MSRRKLLSELIPILLEDENLIAIDKPFGIDVGGRGERTAKGIVDWFNDARGEAEKKLHPVNRLSRYESGIILLTRDAELCTKMRSDLRAGKFRQEYVAVVLGKMSKSKLTVKTRKAPKPAPSKSAQRKTGRPRTGRPPTPAPGSPHGNTTIALQKYGEKRSLVKCATTVDTTHALRAQLRGTGLRLQGDTLNDRLASRDRSAQTCIHLCKLGFKHPVTGRAVTVINHPPDAFKAAVDRRPDVIRPLHAALVRRSSCIREASTNCFRLINGPYEDLRGLVAEQYGSVVMLEVRDRQVVSDVALKKVAEWYRQSLGIKTVYARDVSRQESPPFEDHQGVRLVLGKDAEEDVVVMERGLRYIVRPLRENAPGLFLDQRENRSKIRKLAANAHVLNLFAYTCGFSLAAAAGGAAQTVSVDLSARHLDWGRENFDLNGMQSDAYEFVQAEASEFIRRARKQERLFHIIIIDAPTFAHGRRRGKSFSFTRDLPAFLRDATGILHEGGTLLLGSNNRKLTYKSFKSLVHEGLGNRRAERVEPCPLPADFASDRDHSKSMLVTLRTAPSEPHA